VKRKPNSKYIVKRAFPIFECLKCHICEMEFRLEFMWKLNSPKVWRYYFCKHCCSTKFDVIEWDKKEHSSKVIDGIVIPEQEDLMTIY